MAEDLKFIVAEINKSIKSNHNLISFDSMNVANLLQILVDVLHHFNVIIKFEINDLDPAETNKRILESLTRIQYRPDEKIEPGAFRRGILQGDKRIIYPIFSYIYNNIEKIRDLSYLAQYLIPLSLPLEAMASPDIANLYNEYQMVMDEFKNVHKMYQDTIRQSDKFRELRSDIDIIATEQENVKKRIERTQSRLNKIPHQELLLEAGNTLRIERERRKELQAQFDEQKSALQKSVQLQERLQRELENARSSTKDASPLNLMENLLEETQVLEFIVKQKLPLELEARKEETQILEEVLHLPNMSKEYLEDITEKVDNITKEIQKIIERQMVERGNNTDTLIPFRQQASMVARNKEMACAQLDQATKELNEINSAIEQMKQQLEKTVGEVILRGDEMKQYVNMLRAKNSVYKEKRTELAALKAETSDLQQTLDNLKQQDPNLIIPVTDAGLDGNEDNSLLVDSDSPLESRGITELSRLVDGLQRAVISVRERITPQSQRLPGLRERVIEIKEQCDVKKQKFNALNTTLTAEAAVVQSECSEYQKTIKKLEQNWQELQSEHGRLEMLLHKSEENPNTQSISLADTLNQHIREQDKISKELIEENDMLRSDKMNGQKQLTMWTDLNTILDVKIKCCRDSKQVGVGGTFSRDKGAETFILQ